MHQRKRRESTKASSLLDESAVVGKWQLILNDKGVIAPESQIWSDSTYRILGYEPGKVRISNELFFRHVHPGDAATVEAAFRKAIETCSAYDIEHRLIRKDGTEIIVHETATCEYYYGSDQWVKITGTVEDVTDKRSAQKLESNNIFATAPAQYDTVPDVTSKEQRDTNGPDSATTTGDQTSGKEEGYGLSPSSIRLPTMKDPELEKIYFPELSERLNQMQWHLLQSQRIAKIGSWQIILKDKDTMVPGSHQWSDETFRLFGYEPNEVEVSLDLFNTHVHPDDLARVRKTLQVAVETCSTYDIQHRIIRKDGTEVILHEIGECERYLGSDSWVKVIGTAQDITERKKGEKYKAGLYSIFDNTSLGYTLLDADLNVVSFNRAAYNSLLEEQGLELKEGKNFLEYVSGDRKGQIEKLYRSVVKGKKHSYELSIPQAGGVINFYRITLFPVQLDEAEIMGMAIASENITGRKKSEDIIRASEAKYRAFFENSMDAIVLAETDGNILSANPAACALFRMTLQEICAAGRMGLVDLNHPNLRPMLDRRKRTGYASGELSFLRKDGTSFPGILSSSVYIDANGQTMSSLIVHDITERKLAEEAQEQKNNDLRAHMDQLNTIREEERTTIAREIHDEIGQQLTTLKMGVSCMLAKLKEHELVDETAEMLLSEIDETIKSVRTIASNLRPIVLDYEGLAAAIKWYASEFEKRHKISCYVGISEDVEVHDKKISITLFRVFQETLTNIARHANADYVEVDMKLTQGHIVFSISDNGYGINLEQLKHRRTFGITSMKERVGAVGGTYTIGRNKQKGTFTRVSIPDITN